MYSERVYVGRSVEISIWFNTIYALIASCALIFFMIIGAVYTPSNRVRSMTQHFVSGVVFAAVAVELLPKIAQHETRWTISIGFIFGTLLMLFLMWLTHRFEKNKSSTTGVLPLGLLIAMLVDLFVDGMLIGIAFIAGQASGVLVTVAFATCAALLGLAASLTLKNNHVAIKHYFIWGAWLAIIIPIGTLLGSYVVGKLPASYLTETLAFGVAALLYLAAEELMAEAHHVKDSPLITSMFFWGFLAILLVKI